LTDSRNQTEQKYCALNVVAVAFQIMQEKTPGLREEMNNNPIGQALNTYIHNRSEITDEHTPSNKRSHPQLSSNSGAE